MECRVTVVTLAVTSVDRSREFYCAGLGWRLAPGSNDDIAFFSAGGIVLALYPRDRLAEDARLGPRGSGFGGVTLSQNVRSPSEVDPALAATISAGSKLLKKGQPALWSDYSVYFADPDGHPWEVAHNPHWELTKDGQFW